MNAALELSRETWAVIVAVVITVGFLAFICAPRRKP